MFLRLLCVAPTMRSCLPLRWPALLGDRDLLRPVRYCRQRFLVREDLGRRAGGDDLAAADAGAGAEVDEVVGGPHRVLVVLDDEDGVAHVAQPFEARQQPGVVARVQADARLVENVQHADQAAADLPGQPDALGLAAGERRGGAVERQIMQTDVEQEAEPAADFLEQLAGDRSSAVGVQRLARTAVEPRHEVADGHVAELRRASCRRRGRPGPAG